MISPNFITTSGLELFYFELELWLPTILSCPHPHEAKHTAACRLHIPYREIIMHAPIPDIRQRHSSPELWDFCEQKALPQPLESLISSSLPKRGMLAESYRSRAKGLQGCGASGSKRYGHAIGGEGWSHACSNSALWPMPDTGGRGMGGIRGQRSAAAY